MPSRIVTFSTGTSNAAAGTTVWTNPGNIAANDGSEATAASGLGGAQDTRYLLATGATGLADVPDGATIVGIQLRVRARRSVGAASNTYIEIKYYNGSAFAGDNLSAGTVLTGTEVEEQVGAADNDWSAGATIAALKGGTAGFGVRFHISANANTIAVDSIEATIHYTLPTSGTVTRRPGTVVSINEDVPAMPAAWTNPEDSIDDDDARATATVSIVAGGSEKLKATDFDFSDLPAGVDIDGIEVTYQGRDAGAVKAKWTEVHLQNPDGSGNFGDSKGDDTEFSATDADKTFGGASDLWGLALTRDDVIDEHFGVGLMVGARPVDGTVNPEIDDTTMTIHYSTPEPPEDPTVRRRWQWRRGEGLRRRAMNRPLPGASRTL